MPWSRSVIFCCSHCGYQASAADRTFEYQTAQGPVPVATRYAWCTECKDFVQSELLPGMGNEQQIRSELQAAVIEVESLRRKGTFLASILQSVADRVQRIADLEARIKRLGVDHYNETLRTALLTRRTLPRCLTCASTEIVQLPILDSEIDEMKRPAGLDHIGCEGEVLVYESRMHFTIRGSVKSPKPIPISLDGRRIGAGELREIRPEIRSAAESQRKANRIESDWEIQFTGIVAAIKSSEHQVQISIGHSINIAHSIFIKRFESLAAFRRCSPEEQVKYVENLIEMRNGLAGKNQIAATGCMLFTIWIFAVIKGDAEAEQKVGKELEFLSRIGDIG